MDALTPALLLPALALQAAGAPVAAPEPECGVRAFASDPVARWQPFVAEASLRFGIPDAWIVRVMRAESGGRTTLGGRPIRSPKGAIGLMQLMPGTWSEMRGQLGLGADPDDPRDNILAGAFYLRLMYDRFGYPGLFGAYNAGPARYAAYLAGRTRLPGETIAYMGTLRAGPTASPVAHVTTPPTLFALLRRPGAEGSAAMRTGMAKAALRPAGDGRQGLFAIRSDSQ